MVIAAVTSTFEIVGIFNPFVVFWLVYCNYVHFTYHVYMYIVYACRAKSSQTFIHSFFILTITITNDCFSGVYMQVLHWVPSVHMSPVSGSAISFSYVKVPFEAHALLLQISIALLLDSFLQCALLLVCLETESV